MFYFIRFFEVSKLQHKCSKKLELVLNKFENDAKETIGEGAGGLIVVA
jgi:hypothetical protein